MTPIENLARKLIGVMCEHYSNGVDSGDLCRKFMEITDRRPATFYSVLKYVKERRWIISDGRTYRLSADASWRTPPIEEKLERHQFAHALELRDQRVEQLERRNRKLASMRKAIRVGDSAGPACSALVTIMTDAAVSARKRIQAAAGLLEYKTPSDLADAAMQDDPLDIGDRCQPIMVTRAKRLLECAY